MISCSHLFHFVQFSLTSSNTRDSHCPILAHFVQLRSLRPIFAHFVQFEVMWSQSSHLTHFNTYHYLPVIDRLLTFEWTDFWNVPIRQVQLMCCHLLRRGSLPLLNRATLVLRCGLPSMLRTRFIAMPVACFASRATSVFWRKSRRSKSMSISK